MILLKRHNGCEREESVSKLMLRAPSPGLWFVIPLFGTVMRLRLAGAVSGNRLADSISLIIPEVVCLTLTSAALILGRSREGRRLPPERHSANPPITHWVGR